jgi:hypothetical protein
MKSTSPADQIATALKLRNTLQHYLDMQSWTPAMGAMLFAGIHPPSDCEAIPTTGGTSLDGNPIIGCGNTPFYEANLILQQWNDWCADEGASHHVFLLSTFSTGASKMRSRNAMRFPAHSSGSVCSKML